MDYKEEPYKYIRKERTEQIAKESYCIYGICFSNYKTIKNK